MADEESSPDCEQCKFWDFVSDAGPESLKGEVVGICRRYAPRPNLGLQDAPDFKDATIRPVQWPAVFAYQWCGEFAPISEAGHASPA
jgi:hypothetical protein